MTGDGTTRPPRLTGPNLGCHYPKMSDTNVLSVGRKGRVVIPVDIRRRLGIDEGSELVAMLEQDGVLLLSREAVKRRLRGMFAGVKVSMADELIRDRRAAAVEESAHQ